MEPLSALALAGNILEFVNAGIGIVQKAREIKSSAEGLPKSSTQLDANARRMVQLCSIIQHAEDHEATGLGEVLRQCQAQSLKLRQLLGTLRLRDRSGILAGIGKALKMRWHDQDIEVLESGLKSCRDELLVHLSASVYNSQQELGSLVVSLTRSNNVTAAEDREELMRTQTALLQRIDQLEQSNRLVLQTSSNNLTLEKVRSAILNILRYPEMNHRYHNVAEAHIGSLNWVFDNVHADRAVPFANWLKSQSGVFWVAGKPGSGKSTLMKHIWRSPKTAELLSIWNRGASPLMGCFFFWVGGSSIQKSHEGLLRSLLSDILAHEPSAADPIIEHIGLDVLSELNLAHVRDELLGINQLRDFFKLITKPGVLRNKFCFFVDGLDEYTGLPQDMCDFIKMLASTDNVKICASSRPWNQFEEAFGAHQGRKILLQDYTREDIRKYIHDLLEQERTFKILREEDANCERIVSKLISKSSGVFLWVFLVVRQLRNSLANQDSVAHFERLVDDVPDDLNEYFMRMLRAIPRVYKKRSARAILMLRRAGYLIPVIWLCPVFDDSLDPTSLKLGLLEEDQLGKYLSQVERRLNAYCRDLVQINYAADTADTERRHCQPRLSYCSTSFLHRTVIDFLDLPAASAVLLEQALEDYDTNLDLCKSSLFHLKTLPWACAHRGGAQACQEQACERALNWIMPCLLYHSGHVQLKNRQTCSQIFEEVDRTLTSAFDMAQCPPARGTADKYIISDFSHTQDSQQRHHDSNQVAQNERLRHDAFENLLLTCAVEIGPFWAVKDRLSAKAKRHPFRVPDLILNELLGKAAHDGFSFFAEAEYEFNNILIKLFPPSHRADSTCWQVRQDVVKLLLEQGANPSKPLLQGQSAWFHFLQRCIAQVRYSSMPESAILYRDVGPVMKLFLDHGADPSIQIHVPKDRPITSLLGCVKPGTYSIRDCLELCSEADKQLVLQFMSKHPEGLRKIREKADSRSGRRKGTMKPGGTFAQLISQLRGSKHCQSDEKA